MGTNVKGKKTIKVPFAVISSKPENDIYEQTYEQTFEKEKSVINNHIFHNVTRFAISVNEDQQMLPTFYWLPKVYKNPYKARFIANSSSCTTTELSTLLTSCFTTIKKHVIHIVKKSMKGTVKICFGESKIHVRY